MKLYLIIFNTGDHKAFSSCEKMKNFVLKGIHHFCEALPNEYKRVWGNEEELISEFLRDGGVEELFYTLEIPLDDVDLSIWY